MSLDATFYGFASLADAKAAWHQQLARILATMLDRGVIIDALLPSPPASQQIVATDGAAPAILWALWRALEGGAIASSYWQSTSGASYELLPAADDEFCQQLVLGITKYIGQCKSNARTIGDAIDAAGTIDAVLVIDMGSGWPSNELADGVAWDEFHTFLSLTDTPSSYSGAGSKLVAVNSGATGLEFVSPPYLLAFDAPGVPTASMIVFHHVFTQAVTFVSSLTGSYVKAGTAATAQTDFDLKKNGSSIGTVRFAAAGTTASYVGISASSWAAGDILTLVAPGTADATIADLWGTLVGVR